MRTMIRTNNDITLMGRVLRITEFGKDVASVTLALDNGRDKEGEEIKDTVVDVKCFEPKVYNNLKVGMLVLVKSHFKNSKYQKDGQDVYALDVIADHIEYLESKAVVEAREAAKANAAKETEDAKKASAGKKTNSKAKKSADK